MKPKILLWDIETSFNQVLTFGLYKQNIPHTNINVERHLFCVSYKWYGDKKTHAISVLDDQKRFKADIHDDYYVISEFRKILDEADVIVAHNGDKFDLKVFNSRLIYHGLEPLPQLVKFDTYKLAKKYFNFNSNRLDYLAKFLGSKGKLDNPSHLWQDCFKGDVKAIKHMVKYNKQDVVELEFVFDKLLPHIIDNNLNAGMLLKGAHCPSCKSTDIEWRGYNRIKHNYSTVKKFRRFMCRECGSWSDERKAFKQ